MPVINYCKNPAAVNYDPTESAPDVTCVYLERVPNSAAPGTFHCYAFQDVELNEQVDQSFTLSWSIDDDNWVFFHDYAPDFYFSTRKNMYNLWDGKVFKHLRDKSYGLYHDQNDRKHFFVDIVYNGDKDSILNSLDWVSTVMASATPGGETVTNETENYTLTHITIWNNYQCTGRIPLTLPGTLVGGKATVRKINGRWTFNEFRDRILSHGVAFLENIFNDFAVIQAYLAPQLPWWKQALMKDRYFIIRLEFDPVPVIGDLDLKLYLHEANPNITQTVR